MTKTMPRCWRSHSCPWPLLSIPLPDLAWVLIRVKPFFDFQVFRQEVSLCLSKNKEFSKLFQVTKLVLGLGFPSDSVGKESTNSAGNTGDISSILGSVRSPGEGNGILLHYSCLKNPIDKGAWWATVHGGSKESDMTEHINSNSPRLQSLYSLCKSTGNLALIVLKVCKSPSWTTALS